MTVEELKRKDIGFHSDTFLSQVNYIVKKVYTSITLEELPNVKHFMSNSCYENYENIEKQNKLNHIKTVYEQINVTSNIYDIYEEENYFWIIVYTRVQLVEYDISVTTGKLVRGKKNQRNGHLLQVSLKKKKTATSTIVNRCVGCGNSFNIYENSTCPKCGRVYDLENFDYIVDSIEEIVYE